MKRQDNIINEITQLLETIKQQQLPSLNQPSLNEPTTPNILHSYFLNNNISNIESLKNYQDRTIAQCMLSTYNYNGLILSLQTYESLLPQNTFIEWLLNKNDLDNNIFDESALEEDITIFEILLPYLLKYKDTLFPRLLPEDKSNVFHFSARKNKYISIYFYYKLFYNYNNNCLDIYDNKGDTPLLIACYFSSYESSSVLIELGADINKINKHYFNTPLHKAIESNMESIAKKLIIYGANVNAVNTNGNTPYKVACNINNTELMNTLSNHCCIVDLIKCDTKLSSLRNTKYHFVLMILLTCVIIVQFCLVEEKAYKFNNTLLVLDIVAICVEIVTFVIVCYFVFCGKKRLNMVLMNNIKEDCGLYNDYLCTNSDENIEKRNDIDNNNERNMIIKHVKMFNSDKSICVKCLVKKDNKTVHCIACNKCIENYDHHCTWLNICINKDNFKLFIVFIISIFVSFLLNIAIVICYIIINYKNNYTMLIVPIIWGIIILCLTITTIPVIFQCIKRLLKKTVIIESNSSPITSDNIALIS